MYPLIVHRAVQWLKQHGQAIPGMSALFGALAGIAAAADYLVGGSFAIALTGSIALGLAVLFYNMGEAQRDPESRDGNVRSEHYPQ